MFAGRRDALNRILKERGVQAVLISSPSNLFYFTGFSGGEGLFLMLADGRRTGGGKEELPAPGYLITDSRYYEQVERECPRVMLVRSGDMGYVEKLKELLADFKEVVKMAVEGSMPLFQYMKLRDICSEYEFAMMDGEIRQPRMVKDEGELQKIRRAEAIGDAAFSDILTKIRPGMTEAEIALELEFFMKKQGASGLSFDTIVASGANSSMPHAKVTERKVEHGDFITMDFGCVYQGYCSDMTRTVAVGNPTEEMKKVYQIVSDAADFAMEQIAEGRKCSDIDAYARNHIRQQGYGEFFGHGLGHSVGLEIHEEPRFSPKCDALLKENMVITVEPGIYLPGKFGVRIEDLVAVKKEGYENFTHSRRELIIL